MDDDNSIMESPTRDDENINRVNFNNNNHPPPNLGDDNNRRNVRSRTQLSPIDQSLIGSVLMRRMTNEVTIDDLIDEKKILEMNLNRNYIDVQLVRVITPNKDQKANIYATRRRGNNQDVHFSRIYLCRVHSNLRITQNSRLLYLMEARGSNNTLFDRNMEYRDDGTFTIGVYFRILAPLPIENNMRGDIPLVKTQLPFIVMTAPTNIPSVTINLQVQENTSIAFVVNRTTLSVNRTVPIQTTCSGFLCDKQRVNDWSGSRGCGCYHMTQYRSNLVFQHSVFFDGPNGKIVHSDFSSTKFSLLYLSTHIPGTTRVSALRVSDAYWEIEEAVENVVDYVNDNGGWTIVGWYKRGLITDQSLLAATSNTLSSNTSSTNENGQVGSGNVNFHVVQMLPFDHSLLDLASAQGRHLNSLKYDVLNLVNQV
jgi:hypothetical protein